MYNVIISRKTLLQIEEYARFLIENGIDRAGTYLRDKIKDVDLSKATTEDFLELLVNTKKPLVFAEYEIYGEHYPWNYTEMSILGNIGIHTPVTIFDDGTHTNPLVYETPISGNLLFIPGALLKNNLGIVPADYNAVTTNGGLDFEKYVELYTNRLLPLFVFANEKSKEKGKRAFITIPGIGCGQFAGEFVDFLKPILAETIRTIISDNLDLLDNIAGIYYDPYSGCDNSFEEIGSVLYFVRPYSKGNKKSQLCPPSVYNEQGYSFDDCELYSVVAWDHLSWPGNDFYRDSRCTDDGVKAAATDSMYQMTGITGKYNKEETRYEQSHKYENWEEVVKFNDLSINVRNNLFVVG